jgi:hypothetical protein
VELPVCRIGRRDSIRFFLFLHHRGSLQRLIYRDLVSPFLLEKKFPDLIAIKSRCIFFLILLVGNGGCSITGIRPVITYGLNLEPVFCPSLPLHNPLPTSPSVPARIVGKRTASRAPIAKRGEN